MPPLRGWGLLTRRYLWRAAARLIPWLGAMGYRTSPLRGWTERSGSTPSHGWRHGLQDVARFAGFMTDFPICEMVRNRPWDAYENSRSPRSAEIQ